jgi:hypothetical protein
VAQTQQFASLSAGDIWFKFLADAMNQLTWTAVLS